MAKRILFKRKRKKLIDFFGILGKERGDSMMKDFKRIRKEEIKLTKERLARLKNIKVESY